MAEPDAGPNDEERGQPLVPIRRSLARSSSSVSFALGAAMKRTRIILIWIWLIVGSALALFSVIDGFRAMGDSRRGEAQAAALGLMFSAVVVLGAVQSKRGRRSGPPVLHVASILVLLYAAAYLLFGGVEDTGWAYASLVGALLALSVITLASLRREVQHGP